MQNLKTSASKYDSTASVLSIFKAFFHSYLNAYLSKQYNSLSPFKAPGFTNMAPDPDTESIVSFAIGVIAAFVLAMIATLIFANLIGPVATAIGGALNNKNLTGAANSLTAQVVLIFVTVGIIGIISFLALFGALAGKASKAA